MKNTKKILWIAVSALLSASLGCNVHAESSVTFSGLIGTGFSYSSNVAKNNLYQMTGTHAVSFIAASGNEDLSGDAAAIFRLSNYVSLDTGTNAPFESYVGLNSRNFGAVTLGSQYDLLADAVPYTSERFTSLLATHPGNLDRTVGNSLNNTIKYKTARFGAGSGSFQLGAMYGTGESDATTNNGRVMGAEINYASGPIEAIFVWEAVNGVPYAPAARLGVTKLYGVDFSTSPVKTISQDQNTSAVGLAYTNDGWRIMGNYTYTHLSALRQSETAQTIDVGAYKYVTAQTRIGGGYSYTKLDSYKWNQVHAHLDYALSKRTNLYVLGVMQIAGSGQLAVMRNQPPASSSRQLVLETGITHRF
ncbi:MAG: porin [Collimonas sp.]